MVNMKITPKSLSILVSLIIAIFLFVFYFFIKQTKNNLINCFVEHSKSSIVLENDMDKEILGRGTIIDNVFTLETGKIPDDTRLYKKNGIKKINQGVIVRQGKNIILYSNSSPVKQIVDIYYNFYIYMLVFGFIFILVIFFQYRKFIKTTKLLEVSIDKRVTPSDSKPNLKGFSGIFQNISSLYDELDKNKNEVKRKSKLESLGVLLSKILHDLNNVISTLKIYHYIMNNTNDELKKEECLNKINSSLENMTEIVSETFSFIRGDTGKMISNLRAKDISHGLRAEYSEKAKIEKVKLDLSIEKGLENQIFSVNAMQIMVALRNLVQNSFEELANCEKDKKIINIRFSRFINDLHIEIEDNGRGLPVLVVEKLFTPFITEGKESGTGLGIPIAKEYIEANGGIIDVDTSKNGTVFKINIPLVINDNNELKIIKS